MNPLLMWLSLLVLGLNMAGMVWCLWVLTLGTLWGSVIWLIAVISGFWLAYRWDHPKWPGR